MRPIAIIGSGQAGLVLGHALLKAGYSVTLYSDKTAQQWLTDCKPTGTAVRFAMSMAYERELGLDFWKDEAPPMLGVNWILCAKPGVPLLVSNARVEGIAVDLRLQSKRWMEMFEERGGKLVIEKMIDAKRLEEIASQNDLTILATGKQSFADLFPRDEGRSLYAKPQRHLAMVTTTGANDTRDFRAVPTRYNVVVPDGEAIWTPYYHMTKGPTWNLVFEAKPGGLMDRFENAKSAQEVLDTAKQVIKEVFPWDWDWVKDMQPADPNGWLTGKVNPTIRKPVGHLPSGRVVTFVGDAGMAFDPIAAQGANNGNKMARHLTQAIKDRGTQPFDAAWIESTFEAFYKTHGDPAVKFTSFFLEGLPEGAREMLIAQYGSKGTQDAANSLQRIANEFFSNLSDPRYLTETFADVKKSHAFIEEKTGQSAKWLCLRGRIAIMRDQLAWRLGLRPKFGFQHQLWTLN